jgi:hypothetical protein
MALAPSLLSKPEGHLARPPQQRVAPAPPRCVLHACSLVFGNLSSQPVACNRSRRRCSRRRPSRRVAPTWLRLNNLCFLTSLRQAFRRGPGLLGSGRAAPAEDRRGSIQTAAVPLGPTRRADINAQAAAPVCFLNLLTGSQQPTGCTHALACPCPRLPFNLYRVPPPTPQPHAPRSCRSR